MNTPTLNKRHILLRALRSYIIVSFIYVLLIFTLPINSATMQAYHLTSVAYRLLYFVVILPSLGVWYAAFFGYAKLSQYRNRIASSKEGIAFTRLTKGIYWLVWSLPLSSLAAIILSAIARTHPNLHAPSIIVINYINLLIPLIGYSIIGSASKLLLAQTKKQTAAASPRASIILFVMAGVVYCYLTFRNFTATSLGSTHNAYHIPVWLVVMSIVIPYLYAWFVGLLASYEIIAYSRAARGILYKRPLQLLVSGLVAVLASSIALQYFSSMPSAASHLVFSYRLVIETLFRIVGGIGFILIAIGASRLSRIEEI